MSMSMVLPEGPVRRHRYQPPPTVHSYLNKMNAAVSGVKTSSVLFLRNLAGNACAKFLRKLSKTNALYDTWYCARYGF